MRRDTTRVVLVQDALKPLEVADPDANIRWMNRIYRPNLSTRMKTSLRNTDTLLRELGVRNG